MKDKLDKITLTGMRFYAFHGCLDFERQHGNDFQVDLECSLDLGKAASSDALEDSVDYSELYNIVAARMEKPSRLLEHVAGRIVDALLRDFPLISSIDLWLTKVTPPMGADCDGAGVELHLINDKTD